MKPSRIAAVWRALACAAFVPIPGHGMYMQPDLAKVPLKKILSTLEASAAEALAKEAAGEKVRPNAAAVYQNLARTHAMAYAKGLAEDAEVEVNDHRGCGPWFGFEPKVVPFDAPAKSGGKPGEGARSHLEKAIECYLKSIELEPSSGEAHMGHGWCLEQAGRKAEAIAAYRAALKEFAKSENPEHGALGLGPIRTEEVVGYLVPLLDPEKDKTEIETLNQRVKALLEIPRPITPIAVALEPGTTYDEVIDRDARVRFDADGSGRRDVWDWISPRAAWLVFDETGDRRIDTAIQMFGNRTFMLFLDDGYQAMALLDADRDGRLRGDELEKLCLWHDANRNGISDEGEVKSVSEHGIESFSVKGMPGDDGILRAAEGVRFRDGRTGPTFDVILTTRGG